MLLERPGEVITREELQQRLWNSDVFVDFDHGLNKSIQKLREALGDSATSPRYIQTIPRVGYRFIAPVKNGARSVAIEADRRTAEWLPEAPVLSPAVAGAGNRRARWWVLATGACAVLAILGLLVYRSSRPHPAVLKYTQLTDFVDSAMAPALSPDGHILAFIRGDGTFMTTDPIYVKMLPNGEARRLTDDGQRSTAFPSLRTVPRLPTR